MAVLKYDPSEKKKEVQTVLLNQPHSKNNSCITISTFNLVEVFCPAKNGTGIRLHTHRVASLSIVTVGGCGVRVCCLLKYAAQSTVALVLLLALIRLRFTHSLTEWSH